MAPKASRKKQLEQVAATLKRNSGNPPETTSMPPPQTVPKKSKRKEPEPAVTPSPVDPIPEPPLEPESKPELSEPEPKPKKKARAKKETAPAGSEAVESKKGKGAVITQNPPDEAPAATWENFEKLMGHFNMTPEETTLVLTSVCGPDKRYENYWASYKALPPPSPPAIDKATDEAVGGTPTGEDDMSDVDADFTDDTNMCPDESTSPDLRTHHVDSLDTQPMDECVGLGNGGDPPQLAACAPSPSTTHEVCDIGQTRWVVFLVFSTFQHMCF